MMPYNAGRRKMAADGSYALLPFRFLRMDADHYLVTNWAGEYLVVEQDIFRDFVCHTLATDEATYESLKARHFCLDAGSTVPVELLAAKYRTKQQNLARFTSLFMFVTTLRCDHRCTYCQASSRPADAFGYDMSPEIADLAVDFMFRSPSPAIKVEFQGGESLLHFDIVKRIVERVERRKETDSRQVEFVITSNMSNLNDDILTYCEEHDVCFSVSLDGPRKLHNRNRPCLGRDSYAEVVAGIRRVQESLGPSKITALMTTTRSSLAQAHAIVDEYVRLGLSTIFLRPLNPYGLASKQGLDEEYTIDEWLNFYREALNHVLELAKGGISIREEFACIMLKRMLTPYGTGYVDLQSPAGIGIAGIVFNYDGWVYCSDEARMLAEMGDVRFRMGHLARDSYEEVMLSGPFLYALASTVAECAPQCAECGVLPYCGSDPVRHYRTQHDLVGFKPTSEFCRKNMTITKHLIGILEDDPEAANILRMWAR